MSLHFQIIEARFYPDIADELMRGATAELEARGATHETITVPGVLEVPAALAMATMAERGLKRRPDGFVLLGCVIRGETGHYDIVAIQSARAVMEIAIDEGLALGNGILTVETSDQAWARASVEGKNKGRDAAAAAHTMAELRARLGIADG